MKMHPFLFVLTFMTIFIACQEGEKSASNKCEASYNEANVLLNDFYRKADPIKLDSALDIVDGKISGCPDYNVRMVDLKIRLLILLKDDVRGCKFVDSLDEGKFDKSYKKSLYLKSFRAMGLGNQGDTVNRNKQYLKIIDEITGYLKLHPSDKEAIADLIFIRVQVEEKSKILENINEMQRLSSSGDSMFYDGLKSLVIGGESASQAVHVDNRFLFRQ